MSSNNSDSNKRILFRTDASFEIGTGHVMRCLALAHELKEKGAEVVFVCRDHPNNLCRKISEDGFEVIRLPNKQFNNENKRLSNVNCCNKQLSHAYWLGVDQETDAHQTINSMIKVVRWDWIIVDHYALDIRWELITRVLAENILVIDDLADRQHYCDVLLDQNYFHHPDIRYAKSIPEQCYTLFGPRFALIRRDIREARKFCKMRSLNFSKVLVYFGGNDLDNLTSKTLEALSCPELLYLWVELVIGPGNPHRKTIKELSRLRNRTRLNEDPAAFTELMLRADISIGAGGTTTWERLCLNLPSIVITVADNQKPLTKVLHRDGYVNWLGDKENITVSDLQKAIINQISISDKDDLLGYSKSLVDGCGTMRVAEKLLPSHVDELSLRKAGRNDVENYFFWANEPRVREYSFHQDPIPWDVHLQWFNNVMGSQNTKMWVLQTPQGLPIGQIRFTGDDQIYTISYSLDPIVRGRNWGEKLLDLGIQKISQHEGHGIIMGKVKKKNIASRLSFLKLGFKETIENEIYIFTKEISDK